MSLKGQPRAFIGLDVGTKYLKLIELIARDRGTALTTYAIATRPPAARLMSTIQSMLDKANTFADAVVLSAQNQDKNIVSQLTKDLPRIQLKVVAALSPGQALARLQETKHQHHLICDIGSSMTNCYALNRKIITHQLHYPYGILQARKSLVDRGLIADDIMIGLKHPPSDRVKQFTEQAINPISKLIDSMRPKLIQATFNVVLTGGGALIPGLPEYLARTHNLPVSILNPWHNINHPDGMDIILDRRGPQLALAVALAQSQTAILDARHCACPPSCPP